ncbi:MAG TPA: NUDIX domain-containing protein [Candidatus Elarobacter sp.]
MVVLRTVTGAQVAADAEVLLLRRSSGAFAGAWTFVMGGVENGERATDAARRELVEETGLTATELYTAGELDAFYDPIRDRIVHVPFFVAYLGAGDVALEADVHDEHRWVTFAQAAELLEFPSHRRVLDEVHRAFVARAPQPWRTIRP